MLRIEELTTPIGPVYLAVRGEALCALSFEPLEGERRTGPQSKPAALLRAYFAGDVRALDRVEVDPSGTRFQRAVWKLLRAIPPGETRTYGQLARKLGSSARAVGSANGRNPVGLAIPCHRVIAADGTLCGYAWGVERKSWLLRHESAALQ